MCDYPCSLLSYEDKGFLGSCGFSCLMKLKCSVCDSTTLAIILCNCGLRSGGRRSI